MILDTLPKYFTMNFLSTTTTTILWFTQTSHEDREGKWLFKRPPPTGSPQPLWFLTVVPELVISSPASAARRYQGPTG